MTATATTPTTRRRVLRWRAGNAPPSTAEPVIAFFGLFGVGNFGNEASLRAAHQGLAQSLPHARFVCIAELPGVVTAEHGLPACWNKMAGPLDRVRPTNRWLRLLMRPVIEPARWIAAVRFLRGVDAVIVPGTGILDDFGVRPWQMPYDLFRWSLAARLTRTRLLYLSIGAGPIHNRFNRALMKRALGFAHYASYRDETSKAYMASIGRDVSRDPVFPDLAFSLPRPPLCQRDDPALPLNVGIGVMAYRGWTGRSANAGDIAETYLAGLLRFCRYLLEAGHSITLLTGDDWDWSTASRLREALAGAGDRVSLPELGTMDDVLRAMSGTDIVVATRFHNVVAALMMQRPVVSLGYAKKNSDLLASAGLPATDSHIERFDPVDVQRQFEEVAARIQPLRETLERANDDFVAALDRQYFEVRAFLPARVALAGTASLEQSSC